jgi:hypothetical protein
MTKKLTATERDRKRVAKKEESEAWALCGAGYCPHNLVSAVDYTWAHCDTCWTCKHRIIIHSRMQCGCDTPPRMLCSHDIFTATKCEHREKMSEAEWEATNDA